MVMNLLDKFDAVTVEADFRITPEDKAFCEAHQAAYDAAIQSFHELAFFWEDMENTQKELLGSKEDTYLSSRDGPEISQRRINAHLEWLHRAVISNIVYHFNSTYHVSVRDDYVANNLLPQMPDLRIYENKEAREAYHKKLREAKIRYEDVFDQMLLLLDGRSFTEQAFHELVEKCHKALIAALEKPERRLVLRIIDAQDSIREQTSLDSFIAGFELAWRLSIELQNDENERSFSCRTRRTGARCVWEDEI